MIIFLDLNIECEPDFLCMFTLFIRNMFIVEDTEELIFFRQMFVIESVKFAHITIRIHTFLIYCKDIQPKHNISIGQVKKLIPTLSDREKNVLHCKN